MTPEQIAAAPAIKDEEVPKFLRYPLSLLVRPELLKDLRERANPTGGLYGMHHVPKDATSLYGSHKEEFLRRMGATSATPDRLDPNVDPFSPSQRPRGGFAEGPARSVGGGRRK